jgi:membrane protein implicated in regulation of membrane protease activity
MGAKTMLDIVFLIAAVIGGTVLVCQFALTLLGMGDHSADAGDVGDFHGDFHGGDLHGGDFHGDHAGGEVHGDADLGDSIHGGIDGDHDTSLATAADGGYVHHDSSRLFGMLSFRTLVAAAAFFGVTGKAALSAGYAQSTSFILAVLVGMAAMYGMYWLMQLIAGLSSSGNESIGNAVGLQATVYVPIPAARTGAGKVQLSMQNRIVEYQAVTDDADPLKTGETVEVVGVAGSDIVSVRRIPAAVEA